MSAAIASTRSGPGLDIQLELAGVPEHTHESSARRALFLKDLNCHCIDPNQDFVLNPKAWADVPQGQWGFSSPYYSDYRYARQPSEQLSLGRIFRIKEKSRFQIRGEFFNVFNRVVMPTPSAGNPLQTQTRNAAGVPTSGFGRIDASTVSGQRNGQIVARLEW